MSAQGSSAGVGAGLGLLTIASGGTFGVIAGAAALAGAGLSTYGQIKSASDQANADEAKANLERQQATEIMQREQLNDASRAITAYTQRLNIGSEAEGTGHGNTGVGSQLEIQRQNDLQTLLNDRDAAFQAQQLEKGAASTDQVAGQTRTSGYIGAAGTLLSAAGQVMNPKSGILGPTSSAQALPTYSGDHYHLSDTYSFTGG